MYTINVFNPKRSKLMKNIALAGANPLLQDFIYVCLNNLFINSKLAPINNENVL